MTGLVGILGIIIVLLEKISFGGWWVAPFLLGLTVVWPVKKVMVWGFVYGIVGAMVAGETLGLTSLVYLLYITVMGVVGQRLPRYPLINSMVVIGAYGLDGLLWQGGWQWGEVVGGLVVFWVVTLMVKAPEDKLKLRE